MTKQIPFSFPWCHTGPVFQILARFLFQIWGMYGKKTLPNTAAFRRKRRKSHQYYYSLQRQTLHHDPLATVLLGHFNSGASLDSLVLPHRRPSQEQYLHCCHGNIEPEKVNVCTQVSYKERMEKKKNNSETIMVHVNNGCTLGKSLTLARAEQMLSWFYVCINIDFCTPLENMTRKLKSHIPDVDDWSVPVFIDWIVCMLRTK